MEPPVYFLEGETECSLQVILPKLNTPIQYSNCNNFYIFFTDLFDSIDDSDDYKIISQKKLLKQLDILYDSKDDEDKDLYKFCNLIREKPDGIWVYDLHIYNDIPYQFKSTDHIHIEEFYTQMSDEWRNYLYIPNSDGDEDWCGYYITTNLNIGVLSKILYGLSYNMHSFKICPGIILRDSKIYKYIYTFATWHA